MDSTSSNASNSPKLERPALSWGASRRPDGSVRYWNPQSLIDLGATMASVYYRPLNATGERESAVGMIPPKLLRKVLADARPELEESHRQGIKIIGYSDDILFHPEMLEAEGIDAQNLYAIDSSGERVMNTFWDKTNTYMSCLNNPQWLTLQTQVAQETADAGLDGLMYDLYPLAVAPGYHCHCSYCKMKWADQSREQFGRELPLPKREKDVLDFRDPVDRALFKWRLDSYKHFVRSVEAAVRQKHPDFLLIMNHNADSLDFVWQADALDHPSTELSQVKLGEESSLYLYRLAEAHSKGTLLAVINSHEQITPAWRYRVHIAEAWAGGGQVYASVSPDDADITGIGKAYYRFLLENEEWVDGFESDARVGLLYSWRDHAFIQDPTHPRAFRTRQGDNHYRKAAEVLAQLQVPFDCVPVDGRLDADGIRKYNTLVSPALSLLDDGDAKLLEDYVINGGQLLVIGDLGTVKESGDTFPAREVSTLAQWRAAAKSTEALFNSGKGQIAVLPAAVLDPVSGGKQLDEATLKIMDAVGLRKQIRVDTPQPMEAAVRGRELRRSIHLIKMGPHAAAAEDVLKLVYEVPQGFHVESLDVVSPDIQPSALECEWKESKGSVTVSFKGFNTYSLVRVTLTKAN